MTSSRKGARMKLYALLMLQSFVVMRMGRKLVPLDFTQISTSLLETSSRPIVKRNNKRRRLFRGKGTIPINEEEVTTKENAGQSTSFLNQFMDSLSMNNNSTATPVGQSSFAALILKDNEIYCRKSQMKTISRGKYFVQMLQQGLKENHTHAVGAKQLGENGLPILIKHDDSNGCYPATQKDKYGFPRLTWSIPANSTSSMLVDATESKPWCSAIGMPSYKEWRDINHNKSGKHQSKQNTSIKQNNQLYPWKTKLSKAVWRGSTTCNKAMYGHLPLEDIPRSKLVRSSLDRPDLIDAGYHKFVGKYENVAMHDMSVGRMLKDAIPLEEMTKYKAIIDIDGNNWSARFHALLCTNSVIIKISPDFIEQYYHELEPNVHYIPASLNNLTKVVEYALDEKNDSQMKGIIKNANEWCRQSRSKEIFVNRAMGAFGMYQSALEQYDGGHLIEEWERRSASMKEIDDMVECNIL